MEMFVKPEPLHDCYVPKRCRDIGIPRLARHAHPDSLAVIRRYGRVCGFVEFVVGPLGSRVVPGFFLTKHADEKHVCNTISHETIHQVIAKHVSINASRMFDNTKLAEFSAVKFDEELYTYFAEPPDQSAAQGEEPAEGLNRGADILSCVGGKPMPTKIVAKKDKTTKQKVRFVQTFENGISVTVYVPKDEKKAAALKEVTGSLNFE